MSRFLVSRETRKKISAIAQKHRWTSKKKILPVFVEDETNFSSCPFIAAPAHVPEELLPRGKLA